MASARDAQHLKIMRELGLKSAMVVPLNARGRTLGALTFVSAESGRRYGAADLALAEELASRAAVAVDNSRLYQDLQQAVRTRDEFLASASHDLKNPLTSIKAVVQLPQRRIRGSGPPDLGQIGNRLAQIDAATNRMTEMVNSLLDVTGLQMGRPLELARKRTDLVRLARRVAREHQQTTDRHRIRLETEVPALVGWWDTGRLERVLDNLLGNAIKYSPDGGDVALKVSRESDASGEWARLTVQDAGVGIPAADLPRVVERFQRGENVIGRIAGTGIGLTTSWLIVEQAGGTITAD